MRSLVILFSFLAVSSAVILRIPNKNELRRGEGEYHHDNSGQYSGDDGRYHPDNSGQYNPDGSGAYTGSYDKYKHVADKFGGGDSGSGGAGGGGGAGGSEGFGSARGNRFQGASGGIVAGGGFGAPVALQEGSAAGLYDNRNYAIIRKVEQVEQDGYHYLYETENGITGEEQGKLANKGSDQEAMKASGFFSYTGPDNVVYRVEYTADENGFVPRAAHIPTPPPIPEAILRALEYQRSVGTL